MTDDVYLTTDELAEGLPFVKFGKRVRYFLPDVVKWEKEQRDAT